MKQYFVDTPEGSIGYEVAGTPDGDPVVLLPGFQSDAATWTERGYVERLKDFRLICVDPLGHGSSTKSHEERDYTADRVAAHVTAVLDQEGIDRATIWGFSRGGYIAALCGELLPERCMHVVMGGTPLGQAWAVTSAALERSEPLLAAGDWAAYWQGFPVPLPQVLTDKFERTNDPQALAAVIRAMLGWTSERPRAGLNSTTAPTWAYFGSGEVFADPLREELLDAGVSFYEGPWTGHAETMLDAEGVVAAVRNFLESTRVNESS